MIIKVGDVVKVGSLVKIIYKRAWAIWGWQTGVITKRSSCGYINIVYLTPRSGQGSDERVSSSSLMVGGDTFWHVRSCLEYFDIEVLEEGDGEEITILEPEVA